ncbi:ZYRO0A02948p [Zygosaccharomyces rouxii]|uniref:RNA helicase n=1 Tax=Zygosaccharomyces rouxii (strain ATCC 2623 / CBS 732 / NBRC 1130 / NCYC 568 / NRRL Y-229) TaxID=559307 RepID=C5DPF6_ZYGRC|nr:uncharacterized protein ZYRO0A02948g [Zygosaccharomyces rouxii]KAH9198912.1 P-loop containing nucleoside triphosphate hydrolase protein [Zygosaccharomyces rouxii]CAR25567.1 ZYRO0A02948p [Zygosaccharomyces rouxii]
MARPPDISQLLSGTDKSANGLQELEKPKFLTKAQRQQLLLNKSQKREDIIPTVVKPRNKESEVIQKEDEEYSQTSRPKFNYDTNEQEDTLSNYEPIVSIRAKDLMQRPRDSIEQFYMGKHWTEKTRQEMSDRDWRIFKEDFGITIRGGSVENPLRSWYELKNEQMADAIVKNLKYHEPTPIQRAAVPNVCNKKFRDLLGIASTGSGKTLAFLIPILMKIDQLPSRPLVLKKMDGPLALILAPTRELAQQIEKEAEELIDAWGKNCEVASIVGGHSIEEISLQVSQGTDILVATPGRLIDCLENHVLTLGKVETLVLDEADRMIDMGFEEQVTSILGNLTQKRQTMMFTASMTPGTEKIAAGYLKNPVRVTVSGSQGSTPMIRQLVEHIGSEEQRFQRIVEFLPQYRAPIIIFINYKRAADWLVQKFYKETQYKVTVLYGSKSQEQREQSLQLLRKGKVQIMIATNVAARGLDVPDVSLVINFQLSKTFEDYVHRIGRTGRAGHEGTAITFLDDEDPELVKELYKYLQENNPTGANNFAPRLKEKYRLGKRRIEEVLY